MRFLLLTFVLLSAAAAEVLAEPNQLSAEEKAAGWQLLFDGQKLDGWRKVNKDEPPGAGWTVEDGTLLLKKGKGQPTGGDIITREDFDSFEFTFEWKIAPAGNAGVKYNLPDRTKNIGCEYQLLDDAEHPDAKLHGTTRQTAALYDVLPPAPDKTLHPPGEWNQSRILVSGNHVEHWLNGGKTVEFEFGSEALAKAVAESKFKSTPGWGQKIKSPILLQDHGCEIAFRNLKIRPL